ncbi:MAG: class II glutamine amidotransferase [Myxococcaceae bacterium]
MAVTVAVLTSHPSLLACQLARLSPQVHLHPEPARFSTVGIGSAVDDALLLRRYAAAEAPRTLADPAFADPAGALVYRAELLSPSASAEDTGQPLRFVRWLFAQEGQLEAWPQVQAWVEAELPPHLLTQVGARTLAAAAFALFLKGKRGLERADAEVPAPDAAGLLLQVARALAHKAAQEGAAHSARLLLVATDARCLVAARLGAVPVHFRLLEGSAECARCQLGPSTRGRAEAVRAHQQSRAVVLATAPEPGAHWLELPEGHALAVGPSLQPELV